MKAVNKPMEHYDSSRICADCVNEKCKKDMDGYDFMIYSRECERYDCSERMVEFEECKGNCSDCAWCKLEKNDKGEVWTICTSPDGSFEWREEE